MKPSLIPIPGVWCPWAEVGLPCRVPHLAQPLSWSGPDQLATGSPGDNTSTHDTITTPCSVSSVSHLHHTCDADHIQIDFIVTSVPISSSLKWALI